jgi:hypothetical protein
MKNIVLIILTACFCLNGLSQKSEIKKADNLFKELAGNGCKCVDSINTINKSKEIILNEISKCIDAQTVALQMDVKSKRIHPESEKQTPPVNFNTDKNSKEYKDSYYEMESYMMNNCNSLINKIDASDIEDKKSYSKNPEAQKFYLKGIKESEKGKYKTAITLF